jgi:hypothetical protein
LSTIKHIQQSLLIIIAFLFVRQRVCSTSRSCGPKSTKGTARQFSQRQEYDYYSNAFSDAEINDDGLETIETLEANVIDLFDPNAVQRNASAGKCDAVMGVGLRKTRFKQ